MIDINPNGKKLILSVDGGGLRGMIAIAMLAELEKQTGKTCGQMFDMVAGTSTGAIIAAGIGLGLSAQQLLEEVYRSRLPRELRSQPQGILLYLRYALRGFRNLYDIEPFLNTFRVFSAGKKIKDFQKPIVFVTTRDVRTNGTYFIVSKGPGAPRFADWPVSGAVMASSAAPVFFPPVLGNLIDGGIGLHGNPCFASTVEAMEYISQVDADFRAGNVIHFSLGTGFAPNDFGEGAGGRFGIIGWILYILNQLLVDSDINQVLTTRAVYKDQVDLRRYNPSLAKPSVENVLHIPLKGRPDPEKLGFGLGQLSDEHVVLMEEIGRKYAQMIPWTEANYTPWISAEGKDKGKARDGGHSLPGVADVKWGNPYL